MIQDNFSVPETVAAHTVNTRLTTSFNQVDDTAESPLGTYDATLPPSDGGADSFVCVQTNTEAEVLLKSRIGRRNI